jgi:hypothetical protein
MNWATFWASFSQTHLVTLIVMSVGSRDREELTTNFFFFFIFLSLFFRSALLSNSVLVMRNFRGNIMRHKRSEKNV